MEKVRLEELSVQQLVARASKNINALPESKINPDIKNVSLLLELALSKIERCKDDLK